MGAYIYVMNIGYSQPIPYPEGSSSWFTSCHEDIDMIWIATGVVQPSRRDKLISVHNTDTIEQNSFPAAEVFVW